MTDDKVPDLLAALEVSVRAKADRQAEAIERRNQEIERLRRWKAEAIKVLNAWEAVADEFVDRLRLGESKAAGVLREVERLRAENAAWMNGVADAVEPLGYDRDAACGPADLLPGLRDLHAIPPGVWRVTVHDDGTIEVAGLLEFNWRLRTADELRGNWWVDVPAVPEDGARD